MSRARDIADGKFSGDLEADSPTFVVDAANNRVGIGTSSPFSPLVVAEGTGQHGFEVQPGTLTYVFAYDRATADYGDLDIAGQTLRFSTDNGAERMRIDSAGRVTMPYQPGCFVQFVGNAYTGGTGPMNITSTSSPATFYNDGSHFSFANAQFTAPVSGKYLVSILWYYGSGGSGYLGVVPTVNSTAYGMYWYNNASNYGDASVVNTRVVKVSASDQIGVQIYAFSSDNNPDLLFNVQYLG